VEIPTLKVDTTGYLAPLAAAAAAAAAVTTITKKIQSTHQNQ
jgi:hypothetical protein